tara:strand:+ start:593 stop:1219 length:627 start_codon:yes stop_codon:yes gene_type:complete
LQRQYKDYLSSFKQWGQKQHAKKWLLFAENIGEHISINETAFSNGDLYTIVTNKKAKGKKGALIAMIKGTKAEIVIKILQKTPLKLRKKVKEITLDMAGNMGLIVKKSFPSATQVINRFHVQKLALEALQEIRIKYRCEAIDAESDAIEKAQSQSLKYKLKLFSNGDTLKQLLATSRYLLYKTSSKWTKNQIDRAKVLFELYPDIEKA